MYQQTEKAIPYRPGYWLLWLLGLFLLAPANKACKSLTGEGLLIRPSPHPFSTGSTLQLFLQAATDLEEQEEIHSKTGKRPSNQYSTRQINGVVPPFINKIRKNSTRTNHQGIPLFIWFHTLKIPLLRIFWA